METLLDLKELGSRLATVDTMIMVLAKRRMELAEQVARYKRNVGEKIFRSEVEDSRIQKVRDWAAKHGLNQHFAETLLYTLINESCKQQMILLQNEVQGVEVQSVDEWYAGLKKNLLALTALWATSYDDHYDKSFFATKAYLTFEEELLRQEVTKLSDRTCALDLGCATGRMTFPLGELFSHAKGYDLSPHMIEKARAQHHIHGSVLSVDFHQADIENGIPVDTNSVSFVMMNLGTASDIRDMKKVWQEIRRVLKPGGRFFLSFYNREALLYKWELLPWPTGLAANVNSHKDCLDVHFVDEIFSIYARPYKIAEVEELLTDGVANLSVVTYPTVSAVLPHDLFEDQADIQESITGIDRALVNNSMGAYIIATGKKL